MKIERGSVSSLPLPVPAIVLAAGASTRLGQPKQLLRLPEFGGETLLERVALLAHEAGAAPVYVVLGFHAEIIMRETAQSNFRVLQNTDWTEGMSSSLRLGIRTIMSEIPAASGVLLLVCDQPALTGEHLRQLLGSHQAQPEHIIASSYAGRSGVPAVIPRTQFAKLLMLHGDQGARAILRASDVPTTEIPFPGGEWDIDIPDDLALGL